MTSEKAGCRLTGARQLNIEKTFECGQCFRWNRDAAGVYTGVAYGRVLRIWQEGEDIFCSAPEEEMAFWGNYFDLDADYESASATFLEPEYLKECAAFGRGIRILRQEPWEALCSFIISQCNNIPRIKNIVEALCRLCGEELDGGFFAFPTAERLAQLDAEALSSIRSGYRAQYIINAARAVCSGELKLDGLKELAPEEALKKVTEIHGVGTKVANCFLLYGMHMTDRFPIDTWMKRALKEHFPPDFDPAILGGFSGLAQQYIFYYTRSTGKDGETRQNC